MNKLIRTLHIISKFLIYSHPYVLKYLVVWHKIPLIITIEQIIPLWVDKFIIGKKNNKPKELIIVFFYVENKLACKSLLGYIVSNFLLFLNTFSVRLILVNFNNHHCHMYSEYTHDHIYRSLYDHIIFL
jgi:hypothetical protein